MKTREEVEALKASWLSDPMWEVWNEPGFEEYQDELLAWAEMREYEWEEKYKARINKRAGELGSNFQMVVYIESLEYKLKSMQERLDRLESR